MTRVFAGERTFLWPVLRPVERAVYWCCGVDENEEQHWLTYAIGDAAVQRRRLYYAVRACSGCNGICRSIHRARPGSSPILAFNTSVSFVTNTNWQAYVRRDHDGLSGADGRAHRAQFRLGGDRHCHGIGADPRVCAARGQGDRQFLGRSDPLHALHPFADLGGRSRCSWYGRACRKISAPIPRRRRSKASSR